MHGAARQVTDTTRKTAHRARHRAAAGMAIGAALAIPLRADVVWIREKPDAPPKRESNVTVTEDSEEQLKYSSGIVSATVPQDRVARVVYEGFPEEFQRAEEAEREGDGPRAAALYAKAAEKAGRDLLKVYAFLRAGEALLAAGRFDDARAAFEKCAAAGPGTRLAGIAGVRLAQCDVLAGDPAAAVAALDRLPRASLASEREAWRRYWKGRAQAALGQADAARLSFEDAARWAGAENAEARERAEARRVWSDVARQGPARAAEALEDLRRSVSHPAAQAELFALLAEQYLATAEAADRTPDKRQEALVLAAVNALRVVTTLDAYPEPTALAYDVAIRALSALKDKKADEIRQAARRRFGDSGWARKW